MNYQNLKENTFNYLLERLKEYFPGTSEIQSINRITGGSINDTYSVRTNKDTFFLKINSASRYPGMFEAEEKGLKLLRATNSIYIPKVHMSAHIDDDAFLLLEYVEPGTITSRTEELLGIRLATMHRHTHTSFGLDHDNYIGSLPQRNTPHETWPDFVITERLEPQFRRALDNGYFNSALNRSVSSLYNRLQDIIPKENPSLIHGDLWSGNFITDKNGEPVLIDPAVYYGHREVDLSMMQLFGGFPTAVLEAYHAEFPLEEGWQERTELHNLYPLLVHVNLFGGGYEHQAARIIKKFS